MISYDATQPVKSVCSNKHRESSQTDTGERRDEGRQSEKSRAFNQERTYSFFPLAVQNQYVSYPRLWQLLNTMRSAATRQSTYEQTYTLKSELRAHKITFSMALTHNNHKLDIIMFRTFA